jgi:hypothetical protein
MAYPKPVPAFTPKAFEETLDRVREGEVSEDERAAVDALREEMRRDE